MRLLGQVEVILRDKAVVRIADVSSIPMISSSVYNERREYIGINRCYRACLKALRRRLDQERRIQAFYRRELLLYLQAF